MSITLDGTTGVTAPAFDGALGAENLTGDVAAARITDALNAGGSAPIFACRAWVNFDGTGTVAIRASGNVSSITDNGTGDYTVNFTTAMPDAGYAVVGTAIGQTSSVPRATIANNGAGGSKTASAVKIQAVTLGGTAIDVDEVSVAIFR